MKNVVIRSLSGIVYVGLIVGTILAGWPYFFALMALFATLAIFEMNAMSCKLFNIPVEHDGTVRYPYSVILDCLISVIIVFFTILTLNHSLYIATLTSLALYPPIRISLGLYERRNSSLKSRLLSIVISLMSIVYIAFPLYLLGSVYFSLPNGHMLCLFIFILIWLNDTGAYCFGSTFGKRRLWEELSPKKSWEGFWGGLLCCILFSLAIYFFFNVNGMPIWAWVSLAIIVCAFSTWGDLFESLIKRAANVKDSSHLIPGHGGILDRIDSLLLVVPASAAFLYLVLL